MIFFIILHTAMILITGFGLWGILKLFFPELLIDDYFIIPLFFFVLGLTFIGQFPKAPLGEPTKMVNVYMLMRVIKIFASLILFLIYWFINKLNIRNFAILFIIFYLLNLFWETYIYTRMERYIKYKNDQQQSPKEQNDQ